SDSTARNAKSSGAMSFVAASDLSSSSRSASVFHCRARSFPSRASAEDAFRLVAHMEVRSDDEASVGTESQRVESADAHAKSGANGPTKGVREALVDRYQR